MARISYQQRGLPTRHRGELEQAFESLWDFRVEALGLALLGGSWAAFRFLWHSTAAGAGVLTGTLLVAVAIIPAVQRRARRVLWVSHHRRRWDRAFRRQGLPRAWVLRARQSAAGPRLTVRVARGSSIPDLAQEQHRLAASLGVREVRIVPDPRHAGRADITLVSRDPLAALGGLPWPWAARTAPTSLWEPIPVALDEEGGEVCLSLVERNLLVGGNPGAGKSVAMAMILAAAALDPDAELWLIDGKQVEFARWRTVARHMAHTIEDAIILLGLLREEMDRRYALMLSIDDPETGTPTKVSRAMGLPTVLLAIDELAFFTAAEEARDAKRFSNLVRDVVSRGRAAGIVAVFATQKPEGSVVPTSVRDLVAYRWAMSCGTRQASDTILGSDMAGLGYNAQQIPPGAPGMGFLKAEDGLPVRCRSYFVGDGEARVIAERAAAIRRSREEDPCCFTT